MLRRFPHTTHRAIRRFSVYQHRDLMRAAPRARGVWELGTGPNNFEYQNACHNTEDPQLVNSFNQHLTQQQGLIGDRELLWAKTGFITTD